MKYGNVITEVDGIKFSSKKEAKRWGELQLLERGGVIVDLKRQPRYYFKGVVFDSGKTACYVADFSYYEFPGGEFIVEDVKSEITSKIPLYRLKKALMLYFHNIEIQEV